MKKTYKYILLVIWSTIVFLSIAVFASAESSSLHLRITEFNIGLNESININNYITDTDKKYYQYTFSSNNPQNVSVSESGIFKGIKLGSACVTITKFKTTIEINEETGEEILTEEEYLESVTVNVKKAATGLKMNAACLALGIGESFDLNTYATGGTAYVRNFKTSNSSVAPINGKGVVTGNKKGVATITAYIFNGKTVTCKVYIVDKPLNIKITVANTNVQKGSNNHKLTYKYVSQGLNNKVTFVSSNTAVAKISNKGVVTGIKKGKTTLTVKTLFDNVSVSQTVSVIDDALTLNCNSAQLALDYANVTKTKYGTSVQKRPLEAYIITNSKTNTYKKTLFMDFAVHGFEDAYARDGKVLVAEANKIINYYAFHSSELGTYRLVIVPCANPDGTIAGKNNYFASKTAFGRCTAAHVDMNRDFNSFKAIESKALRDFIKASKPTVYLNMHGWLNETIGTKKLADIIAKQQGFSTKQYYYGTSKGYIIGWVYQNLKIPCNLVEYKGPKQVSLQKDINMIKAIIKNYS